MRSLRYVILLIILIRSSSEGQAQSILTLTGTSIDTICKPLNEYRLIYKDAKLYRYTDSLLKISEAQLSELKGKVSLLEEKDSETKAGYQQQIDYLQREINIFKDQIRGYEKLIRKERRKRRFITGVGILTTAVTTYLFISK